MAVPLRIKFKDGTTKQFNLPIKKAEQTFNLAFPLKVKKMEFNPDHSVLARTKKK